MLASLWDKEFGAFLALMVFLFSVSLGIILTLMPFFILAAINRVHDQLVKANRLLAGRLSDAELARIESRQRRAEPVGPGIKRTMMGRMVRE